MRHTRDLVVLALLSAMVAACTGRAPPTGPDAGADAESPPDAPSAPADVCPGSAPRRYCDGECVWPLTDRSNCGACGHVCDPKRAPECLEGTCGCTGNDGGPCPADRFCCWTGCQDLLHDPANCGGCALQCPPGQACDDGACRCAGAPCLPPGLCCDGRCLDGLHDPENCGACGNTCSEKVCNNGLCPG
ncbi:MAG TPA: hypothetical protein VGQ83_16120 [Polyangia bacterium]